MNNPELQRAWQIIENTGTHLFLTGKAGTGKTTFLRNLKKESPKRTVIVAPTGIAAINAGGVTIHSFFQLPFAPFIPDTTFNTEQKHFRFSKEKINIIRSMDLLIIDDLGTEFATMFTASELFRIVNDRKLRKRPVVISTNLDYRALMEQYSDRVMSRLIGEYTTLKFFGDDIRMKKKYR